MKAKAKGRRQEYRTMRLLEAAGYRTTRAAASLGAFDIIGISATDVVLVHVKSNRPPCPAEMETLRLFPVPQNARKLIHVWHDRKGQPDVREVE